MVTVINLESKTLKNRLDPEKMITILSPGVLCNLCGINNNLRVISLRVDAAQCINTSDDFTSSSFL